MAAQGQQHPIKIYLLIWFLLFLFSAGSYYVDLAGFEGHARWFLIIIFMLLKAGFIVAIFMHMRWERPALIFAILLPTLFLLVLMYLMAFESDYSYATRVLYYGADPNAVALPPEPH